MSSFSVIFEPFSSISKMKVFFTLREIIPFTVIQAERKLPFWLNCLSWYIVVFGFCSFNSVSYFYTH